MPLLALSISETLISSVVLQLGTALGSLLKAFQMHKTLPQAAQCPSPAACCFSASALSVWQD
jgi:hypothetical protein